MFFLNGGNIKVFDCASESLGPEIAALPSIPNVGNARVQTIFYPGVGDKFVMIVRDATTPLILDPTNLSAGWVPGKYTPENSRKKCQTRRTECTKPANL